MECEFHSNRQQEELDRIADMLGHSVTSKTQEGIAGCTASSRDGREGDEGGTDVEGCDSFKFEERIWRDQTTRKHVKAAWYCNKYYVFQSVTMSEESGQARDAVKF